MSLRLRHDVKASDRQAIAGIVASTDFFNCAEQAIAVELIDAYLEQGKQSGYRFVFAEQASGDEPPIAYTCYGFIAGTDASYDLYWIAVQAGQRGKGIGKLILEATAAAVRAAGGLRIYAETSSRPGYEPTRRFYLANGFKQQASVPDFYAPGDNKIIYCLGLQSTRT